MNPQLAMSIFVLEISTYTSAFPSFFISPYNFVEWRAAIWHAEGQGVGGGGVGDDS